MRLWHQGLNRVFQIDVCRFKSVDNIKSRFWGERCSGGDLRTTYTENFVSSMLINEQHIW